jgi:hypothetical protein
MWLAVILGIISLNAMLAIIHYTGPKTIVLTWIPGRVLILVLSLLNNDALKDMIHYTWAASIIPVLYLVIFHLATLRMDKIGGLPRFGKATSQWICTWIISICFMTFAVVTIGFFRNDIVYLISGIIATLLNIVNVLHAPQHIEQHKIQFTWFYIIATNIVVFGVLFSIHELINSGEIIWAGIVSNVPLLAMALIAGASCHNSEKSIKSVRQHIYMLAYQTWPNMATLAVLWLTYEQSIVIQVVGSLAALIIVIGIQYSIIKQKL